MSTCINLLAAFIPQAAGPLIPPDLPVGRFYRSAVDEDEGQEVDLTAVDQILELHKKMHHLKSPLGTKDSPARSCLDLYLQNSDIENGK